MKKEGTVGDRLRKARLKSSLTYEDIYKSLKIHPRILEALEDDRIDPGIGEIYVRSFLKKYAGFLGFEADKILSEFDKGPLLKEAQEEVHIHIGSGEKHAPLIIKDRFKKSMLPLVAAFSLLFTLSIISYAGFKLVKEFKKLQPGFSDVSPREVKGPKPESLSVLPKDQPLVLKVKTKDKVWLRVKSDGKVVFEHTLPEGSAETWQAKDELELWTGRAEALELTLNDKRLESPGKGLIKSIIINREGLKIKKK